MRQDEIVISDFAVLGLGAPTVAAYAIPHETGVAWGLWCKYCEVWHEHGIGEGASRSALPRADSLRAHGLQPSFCW